MKALRIFCVWVASGGAGFLATGSDASISNWSPLQTEQKIESNYPPSILAEGIRSGQAWLMITVDATGSLTDVMVTRYTHPGFISEALRTVRGLEFTPAQADGVPVSVRTELHLLFESSGQVVTLDPRSAINQLTAFSYSASPINHLCAPAELDRLPSATAMVSPLHPGRESNGRTVAGKVMLDFIIDENGTPRMPVVVSSTDPQFAVAAADALNQWRFTPPVRRGKPVAVQVRQEFVFPTGPDRDNLGGPPAKRFSAARQDHERSSY